MKPSPPAHPPRLRRHWTLAPGTVFLNHGSFGACPRPIQKLQAELRARMEAEPVQFLWRHYEDHLEPSRAILARFVGSRQQDIVFVTNATVGVNSVMRSVKLRPGDEVLTTSLDYNACRNALAYGAQQAGAKLVVADIPFPSRGSDQIVESVLRSVTHRTRLAMLDHVTSGTAVILPVKTLVRELEKRGVETLIDGAHAPGMLPLNLTEVGASWYTANLHKWVCAPKGAAFLWVREDKQADMQPAVISHGNNTPRPGYSPFQDRFDWAGTFDPTGWFCVGAAIEWMNQLLPGGWDEIQQNNHNKAVHARRLLIDKLGLRPLCPEDLLGSMATLELPDRFQAIKKQGKIDPEQLALYDKFRIEVPFMRFGNPERRYLRISAQLYNRPGDYAYLADAIQQL